MPNPDTIPVMIDWRPFLTELADIADNIAEHYFESVTLQPTQKPDRTPVTQADLEIETAIRNYTSKCHPNMTFLGEEFGSSGSEHTLRLIIDPIDGTQNFIRAIPIFGTLLAIEEHGEVIAAMISAPKLYQRWWAQKGCGSFQNGRQIHVSSVRSLNEAQVFHGSLSGPEATSTPPGLLSLLQQSWRQRGVGDFYAHMLVASGAGDLACDFGLKAWDIAPIPIIIREAGGQCTNLSGTTSIYDTSLISTNGHLHTKTLELLSSKHSIHE